MTYLFPIQRFTSRTILLFFAYFLFTTNIMAQNYDQDWKAITSDMEKQLPKSALEKTKKLFDKAIAEKSQAQIVKASIYLMSLEPQIQEVEYDSRLQKEIIHLENSIKNVDGGAKSLLISVLADKYNQYAQQNQWKLSQNTTVIDNKSDNIALWSLDQLQNRAQTLYLQSCEDKNTKSIPLTEYSTIVTYANSKYVTTLYDFLHYRAIEGLSNERNYITEQTYVFSIKKEQFVGLQDFLNQKISTKDTSSNKFLTLNLYQKLLKEHLNDANKEVLIDLELRRLEFVYNNYSGDKKDEIYQKLLLQFFEQYKSESEAYYALIELAQLKYNVGNSFDQTNDSSKQWLLKDAHTIYQQIIRECKNSNIVNDAKNRDNTILENIYISVTTEKVVPIQKPILALVNYRNSDKIYYRIYPKNTCIENTEEDYEYDNNRLSKFFSKILANKPVASGKYELKNFGDFQFHTTEVALPSLAQGNYYIIFSRNEDFNTSSNLLTANAISVSNLAYFTSKNNQINKLYFYAVDRNLGTPIANAKIEIYTREWKQNRYRAIKFKEGFTDSDGNYALPISENTNHNVSLIISKDGDRLCENQEENIYYNYYQNEEHNLEQYQLFLDREIYRPNQTIYFKGIALLTSNKTAPKILPNRQVELVFRDVNWQEIAKKTLTTNEYGTFSGTFTAPNGSLLGNMSIQIGGYHKPLRVEEYKRPTFEVLFDTLKSTPKLDDSVKITGKAMTYSGAPLTGARAKYRIVRKMNYPYWKCWWMSIPTNEAEIAQGEVKTNELGVFEIQFKALADENADNNQLPIYNYEINLDVVDITGETHDAQKTVRIGKVDFEIAANVQKEYSKIDSLRIPISILNLNGDKIDKSFQVKITQLISPNILYQERYWDVPDYSSMTEVEFKSKFPMMPYRNEDKVENYPLDKFNKSYTLNSIKNSILKEDLSYWNAGNYKMTISATNSDGKDISIDRYFEIIGGENKNKPLLILGIRDEYDVKENPSFSIISSQKKQHFLYQLDRKVWGGPAMWFNEKINVDFGLDESDRGGIVLNWITVWNNRFYEGKKFINIPWKNKELDIEYTTFRDKLQPGQQEEWQVKIKGKKGEKVMAELLANMYDQSLDVFAANQYSFFPYGHYYQKTNFNSHSFTSSTAMSNLFNLQRSKGYDYQSKLYPSLELPYTQNYYSGYRGRGGKYANHIMAKGEVMNDLGLSASAAAPNAEKSKGLTMNWSVDVAKNGGFEKENKKIETSGVAAKYGDINGGIISTEKTPPIKVRTILNETVFFLPHLMTDKDGNVVIKFKMNEALTKWKFMALATTKDLQIGYSEKTIVTQKDLMITPNAPRFMRENDVMDFTAKIANLSDKVQSGTAFIELYDAVTNQSVEKNFGLNTISQPFSIPAGKSTAISWNIKVPEGISALTYRVIAKSDKFSDGEENSLPVLTDRMLVTETMPMHIRANQTKSFTFKEMQEKIQSPTLKNVMYRLEYTSNPMWYAIQSLPYLMEYPHECSEQLFNRYFANALSSSIIQQFPKIKTVFDSWKGTEAMQSNLSKNQELKSALLEETPWVFEACREEEQRRNIALLFDLNKIANEEKSAVDKLAERQMPSGGFPWFPGSRESEYITQNIVEGFGHLKVLGVENHSEKASQILEKAIPYLDQNIVNHYNEMERNIKRYGGKLSDDHLDAFAIHYLYTRSYFKNNYPAETQKVIKYYHDQAVKYWTKKSMYEEGMLALYFHRTNDKSVTADMMKSFRERALKNDEKGMYWDNPSGYWWYQLPIETHSLMIEVFDNLSNDQSEKDDLRIFLLKNKQTNSWKTTKATAAAIFALLGNQPTSKLEIAQSPKIKLGGRDININLSEAEQGTGYFKKTWIKEEVLPNLSQIEIVNPNPNIAWGAVYWQYNEKLNNIKINTSSPLRVEKKMYKVLNTERGEELVEIPASAGMTGSGAGMTGSEELKIGDRVRVKLMLYVEREMEFLHLKDMRASGFEPREQVSGYRWSGGLGYYQTSRDASMNFFIDYINKGTYTIEYDLNTNIKGVFSNGITTFQSMYAPEFNSHSEGREVKIK